MKKFNNTTTKLLLIWLVPLVITGLAVVIFGLNLGVDYASANVIELRAAETFDEDSLRQAAASIQAPDRIERYDDGTVRIYFQNVDLAKLTESQAMFEEKLGELTSFETFVFEPTPLVSIASRIVYGLLAGLVVYFVFIGIRLKDKGLRRLDLLYMLITEKVILGSIILLLAGLINLVAIGPYKISTEMIILGLAYLVFMVSINLFLVNSFNPASTNRMTENWTKRTELFQKNSLKLFLVLSIMILSLSALNPVLLLLLPVFIVAFLYSLYLFIYLKPLLWQWLYTTIARFKPFSKNKFLTKEW